MVRGFAERGGIVRQRHDDSATTPAQSSLIAPAMVQLAMQSHGEVSSLMVRRWQLRDRDQLIALEQAHEDILHGVLGFVLIQAPSTRDGTKP